MPTISKAKAKELGIPSNSIQTILFEKSKYTKEQAREWLKKNKYKYGNYRQTINDHRFMQVPPIKDANYYSKKSKGIILVFQNYDSP